MGLLEGKVAVITGSTRGLGFAIAQVYAREGARVVLSGRSESSLAKAVETLQATGASVTGRVCDVGDLAQVKALAEHALQSFGQLDIWVNNAGIADVYGPTVAVDPTQFEQVLRTNIFGTYYGSLVAIQHFQHSSGKLINLLGRGDRQPVAYQNAYASSKAWVRNFTLALAKEEKASGIGIYAFNPGLMDTDLLRKITAVEGYDKRLTRFSAIIRLWGNPPSVPAEKALWLVSSATDGKTGLEVAVLTKREQLAGALRELGRLIKRQPAPDTSLAITTVPPFQLAPAERSGETQDSPV